MITYGNFFIHVNVPKDVVILIVSNDIKGSKMMSLNLKLRVHQHFIDVDFMTNDAVNKVFGYECFGSIYFELE